MMSDWNDFGGWGKVEQPPDVRQPYVQRTAVPDKIRPLYRILAIGPVTVGLAGR